MSPPKSVTLQALVSGDERLIQADRDAAMFAVEQAERLAFAHQHGGKDFVQTGNICAVIFEHYDARESITSQHGPMPQLHHHVFVANVTQRPDGDWRALHEEQIYKARAYIDAIYMAELARNVQRIGYGITRGSDGSFELEGFTRQQIEAFSERCLDIEREKVEQGITNPIAARAIIIETRKAKREHDPDALRVEREALAVRHGIDLAYRPIAPAQSLVFEPQAARQSLDFALAHETYRNAAPDHRKIVAKALRHGVGRTDLAHINEQIAVREQARQLFSGAHEHNFPMGKHTTPEMLRLERENLAMVRERMHHGQAVTGLVVRNPVSDRLLTVKTEKARDWIAAKKLLPDQAQTAFLTLTTSRWASAIEGLAGTAKTTLVGGIKEFAEAQGWTVRGFGPISGARYALDGVGIQADTVAGLLAKPLPAKTGREMWIVDESSLLDTRQLNQLLKLAIERGIERIVFVGDQKQHLAIGAGHPMMQLLDANLAVAYLTTIRRQEDPQLRKAIELIADQRIAEGINLLEQQKRIVQVPDKKERYARIAADYLDAHQAGQNCLVVSPANEERKAINQTIRATLVEHRYVGSIGREHQILIPRDMTPAQLRNSRSYREGDVLYFTRGSKAQEIPKRAYLKVSAVNENSLSLQFENGRQIEFDPARLKGVRAYTAETRTIAAGDRLEWREPDNKRRIANHAYATITKLDDRDIEVRFDNGRKVSMPLAEARKVDLGYASTSHSSQGSTFDRAIVNIDSRQHAGLVNQRQFYVSDSRPRIDLRVYTDDTARMKLAVARTMEKELALDLVKEKQKQQQQYRPSAGMRM